MNAFSSNILFVQKKHLRKETLLLCLVFLLSAISGCKRHTSSLRGEVFIATQSRDNVKLGDALIYLVPNSGDFSHYPLKGYVEELQKKANDNIETLVASYQKDVNRMYLERQVSTFAEKMVRKEFSRKDILFFAMMYGAPQVNPTELVKMIATNKLSNEVSANLFEVANSDDILVAIDGCKDVYAAVRGSTFDDYIKNNNYTIQTARSNADGLFSFENVDPGEYFVISFDSRRVADSIETYCWAEPVKLEGKKTHSIALSNSNMVQLRDFYTPHGRYSLGKLEAQQSFKNLVEEKLNKFRSEMESSKLTL